MIKLSVLAGVLRLHTLPLSMASMVVGAGLAVNDHRFNVLIFFLSLFTALLLQILSNLSNDYGDLKKGVDNASRIGPKRPLQRGLISPASIKKAISVNVVLTFFSGALLLSVALKSDLLSWLVFFGLGVLSIIVAMTYTLGKMPYGYWGMGDIVVFLFFGMLGVLGSHYLYATSFNWLDVLPAISIGLLSVAVLNINNMRDMETDKISKKITLVVLFGRNAAFKYQVYLVLTAPILMGLYFYLMPNTQTWQYVFLLILSPLIKSLKALKGAVLMNKNDGEVYNTQIKNMSITTFVFALIFMLMIIPSLSK